MPETKSAQWKAVQSESDQQARVRLASLVESGRRRFAASSEAGVDQRLNEANARLAHIEAALTPARLGGSPDGIS